MGTAMSSTIASGALRGKLPPRSAVIQEWQVFDSEKAEMPQGLLPMQAALWEKSCYPDGLLLRGQALKQAEVWALRHESELSDSERDYLIACQSAESCAGRERSENSLLRILLAAVTIACLMSFWHWLDGRRETQAQLAARDAAQAELLSATAARAVAETQLAAEATARQKAEEAQAATLVEREQAQRARLLAESRALAAYSEAALSSDAQLAILLAMESGRAAQLSGLPGASGYAAHTALDRALEQLRARERRSLRRSLRSPDGARSLQVFADGTATIRQVADERALSTLAGSSWIDQAAWSPDGARILAGGCGGRAAIFSALDGALLLRLPGHQDLITHVSWSPDGQKIATASHDGTVVLWEAENGARIATLRGQVGDVWNSSWAPDSARIVTLGLDSSAILWDARSGRQLYALDGHAQGIASVVWDHTGATCVSIGRQGNVWLWEAASGNKRSLFGKLVITQVGWSADDRSLLAVNRDGEAFLWDENSGVRLLAPGGDNLAAITLEAPKSVPPMVEVPACAPATTGANSDLLAYACRRAGRNLTPSEWTQYVGTETPYHKSCAELP